MALRERMLGVALSRREWTELGALVAALAVLSALVVAGAFTRVDQFSLDHLMPWLDPLQRRKTSLAGYWRPFPLDVSFGAKLVDCVTYPCSLLISALIVCGVGATLWQRGLRLAAALPAAAWIAGNGVEWIGKHVLTRPDLYGHAEGLRIHVSSFDDSFPSGHTIRGILIAYAIALVWKRAWPWTSIWAALVPPALVLQSAHAPTDVVGGALIGLILVVGMRALSRPELESVREPAPSGHASAVPS